MILIDGIEILTVLEGVTWNGSKDSCTRTLSFKFMYNPLKPDIPVYRVSVGSKVEFKEENITRFFGYVESLSYNTEDDTISITAQDATTRLIRSKFIGRMQGTLTELANNICGAFGIQNGIKSDDKHVHNIVSNGDLTYYEVLKTACDTMFTRYTLYMDGANLTLLTGDDLPITNSFVIGSNIRSSQLTQSMGETVTRVLVIDNNGKVIDAVEDKEGLEKLGLFQECYSWNKDSKNNLADASKMLKGVQNEGSIVCNNDNNCISGKFIEIQEPVNNFKGVFEIISDSHTLEQDSYMELEVKYVKAG